MVNITFKQNRNASLLEKKLVELFENFERKTGLETKNLDVIVNYEKSNYTVELRFLEKQYKRQSYNPIHAAKETISAVTRSLEKLH